MSEQLSGNCFINLPVHTKQLPTELLRAPLHLSCRSTPFAPGQLVGGGGDGAAPHMVSQIPLESSRLLPIIGGTHLLSSQRHVVTLPKREDDDDVKRASSLFKSRSEGACRGSGGSNVDSRSNIYRVRSKSVGAGK